MAASGAIWLYSGSLAGQIKVFGDVAGGIAVDQDVAETFVSGGSIEIGGNLTRPILIYGSLEDSTASDEIVVEGAITGNGCIAVDYDGWQAADTWHAGATIRVGSTTYTSNTPGARVWEIQMCKGDMNNDGVVDFHDADPFLAALYEVAGQNTGYSSAFPGLKGSMVYHGDANCDNELDFFDVDPFVDLVFAGCCTTDCTPCESFGDGPSSDPSAEAVADALLGYVDPERAANLISYMNGAAESLPSERQAFWAAVEEAYEAAD